MLWFWIAPAILAFAASALILARAAAAARSGAGGIDPRLAFYRRALAEVDELVGRGLLSEAERRAQHAEAGRRLLAAAEARPPQTRRTPPRLLLLAAAAPALLALAIYLATGSPGLADRPFSARLAQWRAQPQADDPEELAAVLRVVADQRPADPEPLTRLAQLDLTLGDADGAIHALKKAAALRPDDARLLVPLGEIETLKADGVVGPEAQADFRRVERLDPANPAARYYLARAQIGGGAVAAGLAEWRALLAALPENDPRRPLLAADIASVEKADGLVTPAAAPAIGPAAIATMVQGLADRLQAHPDDPDGWVRLVRAYAVLGETEARDSALAEARRRYASDPPELARLAQAAQR